MKIMKSIIGIKACLDMYGVMERRVASAIVVWRSMAKSYYANAHRTFAKLSICFKPRKLQIGGGGRCPTLRGEILPHAYGEISSKALSKIRALWRRWRIKEA